MSIWYANARPCHRSPLRWLLVVLAVVATGGLGEWEPLDSGDAEEVGKECDSDMGDCEEETISLLQKSAGVRLRGTTPLASEDPAGATSLAEDAEAADGVTAQADNSQTSWHSDIAGPFRSLSMLSPEGQSLFSERAVRWWHTDVFKDHNKGLKPEQYLTNLASMDEWALLYGSVTVLCLLDFFVLQRFTGSVRNNLLVLGFWVLAGLAYNAYFAARYGAIAGLDWLTGFLLEWMLSIDNLFVFHLIFKVYRTPEHLMHKALFFGIAGGVLFRIGIFIALGTLLRIIHWVRIVFGVVLIYSGIQAVSDDGGEEDVSNTYAVKALNWLLGPRLMKSYDQEGRLFPQGPDGKRCVSLLFFIIVCLELTDVLFAVDSVSAKVAQLQNQYTAYSSSVMAIFGLRAMFFVVKDLVEYFDMLKYGICIILVFIGVEMIASPVLHLESATVCIVIASVFVVSLTASTAKRLVLDRSRTPADRAGREMASSGWGGAKAYEAS